MILPFNDQRMEKPDNQESGNADCQPQQVIILKKLHHTNCFKNRCKDNVKK